MSDNEMRNLCRHCLEVRYLPHGVLIGLNIVEAERRIRSNGWIGSDVEQILNETLQLVSDVARKTVDDVQGQLQTGKDGPIS